MKWLERSLRTGFAVAAILTASIASAETITIQFFLGDVQNTTADSVGVLVADVNGDGFDSVFQAGAIGTNYQPGTHIAGSDDVIIAVTRATGGGYPIGEIGFADTFAGIDYDALGVSAGDAVRFFWFPGTDTQSSVIPSDIGFESYENASQGTGGDIGYTLPAGPGVFTLTHLTTSNGGGLASVDSTSGTAGPIVQSPVDMGPVEGGSDVTLSVVTQGAGPYTFQWFEGEVGDASNPVGDNKPTLDLNGVLYSSPYWVRVSDGSGSVASNAATVEVTGGVRPEFTWNLVDGAEWYRIYIKRNGVFWKNIWVQGQDVSSWVPDSNLPVGNYQWWVIDWSSSTGYGQWSNPVSFSLGIPQPTGPSGVLPDTESTPTLTWTRSLGIDSYRIYITRNGTFWKNIWVQGAANNQYQFDASSPLPPGEYTFWINTWSAANGYGVWSDPMSFSFGFSQPLSPSGAVSSGDLRPTLTWSKSPTTEWYYLWINRNGVRWRTIWIEGADNTQWLPDTDLPSGVYSFYIATWTSQEKLGKWSSPMTFSVGLPEPLDPRGLLSSGVYRPTFTWNGVVGMDFYKLYLKRNGVFYGLEIVSAGPDNWTPTVDFPSGVYSWYIQGGKNSGEVTPWVQAPDFEIQGMNLLAPSGLVSATRRPLFQWEEEPGATWYYFWLARSSGERLHSEWIQGSTEWTPSFDLADGNYRFYVRPWYPDLGNGTWVGPLDFSINLAAADPSLLTSGSGSVGGPEIAPGDFNGDDVGDLVLQDAATGEVRIDYLSQGESTGTAYLSIQPGDPAWQVVGHGDLDGDQDNDLVWQNSETGEILAWTINGGSSVDGILTIDCDYESAEWSVSGVADFNADGHPDLLVSNTASGAVEIAYLKNFAYQSSVALTTARNEDWEAVAALDLDGDGPVDLVWKNSETGVVEIEYLAGKAPYGVEQTVTLGANLAGTEAIVAVQDIDEDNSIEIVVQDSESGKLTVWDIEGAQVTVSSLPFQPESSAWKVRNVGGN